MSNQIIYKVDLIPMDLFFFGGEQHFGEGDDANYFVRSNYFPQQTGILGMIRHQLLIQNGCIPLKGIEEKASLLIGDESYNIKSNVTNFGAIKRISPVFISTENGLLFPDAFEFYINKKDNKEKLSQIEINSDKKGQSLIYPDIKKPNIISVGDNYLGKYEINELLVSSNGVKYNYRFEKEFNKSGSLPENGVFIETGKPGIQKSIQKIKGEKDQGFYKQYSYAFPKETSFTFFVEIDRSTAKIFSTGQIMLGGEKSPFRMIVTEYTENDSPFIEESAFYKGLYSNTSKNLNKIICVSDCIANDQLAKLTTFMSNPMIYFRNTRTKVVRTLNYNRMDQKDENLHSAYDSPVRSNKYQILKRGSVLWVTDSQLETVLELIKKDQYRVIGYNYIKTIQHL